MGVQGNFADLPRRLVELGLRADMVLADLGFSSNQMEDASRGLSFMRDGPLDMRLDPTLGTTASDLVNSLSEVELCKLLSELGEEPGARTIARKVVRVRGGLPITTTEQFADIVRSAVGRPKGKIDSATKSFQALRVAVNDEFGALDALLAQIRSGAEARTKGGGRLDWLTMGPGAKGKVGGKLGARAAIIGFHSLEDRRVKKSFADLAACGLGVLLTKGPIEAQESEVADNPRSRSAKLRAVRISDVTIGAGSV
jgi:16S rRNA (cytosine1402-N4)-methyltransferase